MQKRQREEVGRDGRGTWSDGVELELAFLGLNHRRLTGSPTLEREREVGGAMVLRSSRGCERASEERIETEGRWAGLKGRGGGARSKARSWTRGSARARIGWPGGAGRCGVVR
jgi:hypothetical protein